MKQTYALAAMATAVILNTMAYGQQAAQTKAPATPPSAPAVADGLAQWKHWPDSNAQPDSGSIFGLSVDRTTGDLFIVHKISATTWGGPAEIWKSTDQAKTFSKPNGAISGAPFFSCYAFSLDLAGKRMAFFAVGGSGGMSIDGGLNWTPFAVVKRGVDCGVVDWEDTGKTCLASCHEDPAVVLSHDAGATWQELAGFVCPMGGGLAGPVGIFDAKTLIVGSKDGTMQRSTDGGATWTKLDNAPKSTQPYPRVQNIVVFKGAGYLVTPQGLSVSKDKGATWQPCGSPVNISGTQKFRPQGPFFGADEKQIVLVGWDGVFQTTDGGAHCTKVAPYPGDYPVPPAKGAGGTFAWDPVHNIVYGCGRGLPAVYCQLPPQTKH